MQAILGLRALEAFSIPNLMLLLKGQYLISPGAAKKSFGTSKLWPGRAQRTASIVLGAQFGAAEFGDRAQQHLQPRQSSLRTSRPKLQRLALQPSHGDSHDKPLHHCFLRQKFPCREDVSSDFPGPVGGKNKVRHRRAVAGQSFLYAPRPSAAFRSGDPTNLSSARPSPLQSLHRDEPCIRQLPALRVQVAAPLRALVLRFWHTSWVYQATRGVPGLCVASSTSRSPRPAPRRRVCLSRLAICAPN